MTLKTKLVTATPWIALIVYLILGFCWDLWHPGWVVFFAIPVVPILLGKKRSLIYTVLCIVAFLVMGFGWNLWHPGWIVFLTIPVFSIFFKDKED